MEKNSLIFGQKGIDIAGRKVLYYASTLEGERELSAEKNLEKS